MFGSVPKNLWNKVAAADDQNRILLATRSLMIETDERKILVDVGCGDKWPPKLREIFAIDDKTYEPVLGVTDVLLTHLHFDHAGGVSRIAGGRNGGIAEAGLELCYPAARHCVSRTNLENAQQPHERERASYLAENVQPLQTADLHITEDGQELWPGLTVHQVNGHTTGLQMPRLVAGGETVVFPSDLMPTSAHIPIPYVMGYDMCAVTAMEEKRKFLHEAIEGNWIVVFEHDPALAAARLKWDDKGRPTIAERLEF